MRVYGSSPLYNYVELIFRSKKMFIASVLLATVVTAGIAAMRSGTYSAQALVYLTGAEQVGARPMDDTQKGSMKYKLNLLSVSTRDPKFIKDAFKDHGLNKGMTEDEFDKFCKDARQAMTFASGDNVLEINIRWRDSLAADIIKAFYSAFSRRVLDEETVASTIETKTLRKRLEEYDTKQKKLDDEVVEFKKEHIKDPLSDYGSMVMAYERLKQYAEAGQNVLDQTRIQLAEVQRQLDGTQRTQIIGTTFARDPAIQRYEEAEYMADAEIADLMQKYTEDNPKVKQARAKKATITKLKEAREKLLGKKAGVPGTVKEQTESTNPTWVALDGQRSQLELALQAKEVEVREAQIAAATAYNRAQSGPKIQQEFGRRIKDLGLYTSIRDNVRARLEQATMTEKQEREMHLAEMKMIVEPESELEVVGAKNILFYAAGPLLGLLIAFAFSLLGEALDHSLRTPVEVEKYLGKPVLAVLPRVAMPKDTPRRLGGGGGGAQSSLPSG